MLLFTTILNISSSTKQKKIYILINSILGLFCSVIIPKPFGNILTIFLMPLTIMIIFRVSFMKGILSELLILICVVILEMIFNRFFLLVFNIDYDIGANIPIFRLLITVSIYIIIFLISFISKRYN